MTFLKYFFSLSVFLCLGCAAKKFPPYITLCHQDDPEINACFLRAVDVIRPHLKTGIPELQLPPIDPLVLPEIILDTGNNFKAVFHNVQIFHADDFSIDKLDVDLKNSHLQMRINFPGLRIKSEYQIDGRILILQLRGKGPADGNYTDVRAMFDIQGFRQFRDGKEYLKLNNNTLDLTIGKPVLYFDKLFGDNEELNVQTNRVINENIDQIIDELKPVLNEVITQFAFGLVSRIFDRFSFEELFPK